MTIHGPRFYAIGDKPARLHVGLEDEHGVAEHLRPIGESQIGGDQQRRVLIEFAARHGMILALNASVANDPCKTSDI
jgi:hypothetical protein